MLDIYPNIEPIDVKVHVEGNTVTIEIKGLPISEISRQNVYYDFPKTTDGIVW